MQWDKKYYMKDTQFVKPDSTIETPATFMLDKDMQILHVNEVFLDISGGELSRFAQKSLYDFIDEQYRPEVEELIEGISDTSPIKVISFKWNNLRNESIWLEGTLIGNFGEDGKLVNLFGTIKDITHIKYVHRTRAKIDLILDKLSSFAFDISLDGRRIHYLSPKVYDILGYRPEAFYNQSRLAKQIIDPEDFSVLMNVVQNISDTRTHTFEFKIKTSSGQPKLLQATMSLGTNLRGEPNGIHGVVMDISKQKIRKSLLEGILGSSLGNIFLIDPIFKGDQITDFVVGLANRKAQEFLGLPLAEILHKSLSEVLDLEVIKPVFDQATQAFQAQSSRIIERLKFSISGEVKTIRVVLDPLQDSVVLTIQDISDQVESEEALRMLMNDYEILFNGSTDAIFLVGVNDVNDFKYLRVNEAYTKITHTSKESLIGSFPSKVFGDKLGADILRRYRECLEERKILTYEEEVSMPHGNFVFLTTLNPVFDNDKIRYLAGVSRDISELKSKELALKESEERFRDLFENAHDLIQSVEPDGTFNYVNPAWKETLGYDEKDLEKLRVFDVIHSDYLDEFIIYFEEVLKGQVVKGFETVLETKSGGQVIVEGSSSCRIIEGQPAVVRTIYRNITTRKEAEAKVESSQKELKKLALVTEKTENAVILCNIEGKLEWTNRAFNLITSFLPSEENELVYPDSFSGVGTEITEVAAIKDAISKGGTYDGTLLHYKKTGEEYWTDVEIKPSFDDKGKLVGAMVINTDITERKQTQETLAYLSQFQRVLMETATLFINSEVEKSDEAINRALADVGSFLEVDRAYLFEYNWDEKFARNSHEWCAEGIPSELEDQNNIPLDVYPEWVSSHMLGLKTHVERVSDLPESSRMRGLLESKKIKTVITMPLMDGDTCLGYVGFDTVHKVKSWTEDEQSLLRMLAELFANAWIRIRYEHDLVKAKVLAEEATITKSRFLANMSHEIRTPMNGVIGFMDLLSRTQLNKEQEGYLSQAQIASDMLLHVLNDVLDFSKIEADKLELKSSKFNLRDTVENIVLLLAPNAFQKGLELNLFIKPDVNEYLLGDSGRVRQILSNLISNAIKFTDQGEVYVSVESEVVEDGKHKLKIEVKDTGIGMSEDTVAALFEPFVQADNSSTRQYGGSGLGLSISKKIANLMDGDIQVKSELGRGSVFTFFGTFEKAIIMESDLVSDLNTLNGQQILVVDDNENNRIILNSYLTEAGCKVDLADSGEKAISMLFNKVQSDEFYSLAILDHQMPGMDGVQLAQIIKAVPEVRDIKLVMLTSMVTNEETKNTVSKGFSGFLSKPIKRNDLLSEIAAILNIGVEKKSYSEKLSTIIEEGKSYKKDARILLVEDQEVNAKLLLNYLKEYQFAIDLAKNGKEAVDAYHKSAYDLILMDCQMPVMDGFSATRHIRDIENNEKHVPIIALTAYAMGGDRERCLAAGMDDYITKPINFDLLIERIKFHLTGIEPEDNVKVGSSSSPQFTIPKSDHELDKDTVSKYFREQTGMDKESVDEIFELFFSSLPDTLGQIEQALSEGDWERLGKLAHKIKGTGGNLMIQPIFDMALDLEKSANEYDRDKCLSNLSKLRRMLSKLME